MSAFLSALNSIANFLFTMLSQIFNLYTTSFILMFVWGIWVTRKVFMAFHRLKG